MDNLQKNGGGAALRQRGLKPVAVLAARREHGDRLRYMGGCRCDLCRRANSAYESMRQKARREGDWNGIVAADKARLHIERLSSVGVGRRAIGAASDVSDTVLFAIRSGEKKTIRARTERRILAVTRDMASDHGLVDAGPTWELIRELLAAGFTKAAISHRLGYKTRALQLGKERVLVKHAYQVERLYRELIKSDEALIPAAPTWRLIDALRVEEYTDKQLARSLGWDDGELRLGKKRVTRRDAQRVERLYQQAME